MITLRYKLVRGALDFGGVVNRATARSRYGGSLLRFISSGVVSNRVKQPRNQNHRPHRNSSIQGGQYRVQSPSIIFLVDYPCLVFTSVNV